MSKRITNKDIHDLFIKYFEGNKPFTPSEKRMNGIKITQLRKNVKQYIADNEIDTDLSINEMIIDIIKYSNMLNFKFRSVASLGYDVMPKSIAYWQKRRKVLAEQENNAPSPNQQEAGINQSNQQEQDINNSGMKNSYKNKQPKWMNNDEW